METIQVVDQQTYLFDRCGNQENLKIFFNDL